MNDNSEQLEGVRQLYEFSRTLLNDDDPDSLLDRLVDATRSITEADEVILFEVEQGRPVIGAVATDSAPSNGEQDERPEYSATVVENVIKKGAPVLIEDISDNPRFGDAQSVQLLSITSAMGAPLYHCGELLGVIYAARQRLADNFTKRHCDLMTVVASQAGLLLGRLASTKARREIDAKYRGLVEMSPSTILVIQDDEVVFANRTAGKLWELEGGDPLQGRSLESLFDPWRSQALLDRVRSGEAFSSVDAWLCDEHGERAVPVEVVGRPITLEGQRAMQLLIRKSGARRALLAQRVRSDRLTVMGTMAATVGHEINNPLSYVYANLDFVVEELEARLEPRSGLTLEEQACDEIMAGLRSAREGTERIRAVVDSIQNFTRLDDEGTPTVVAEPLKSSLRIARSKLASDVELQIDIRPTDPVPISASRLGQVFLNILINGAQAINEMDDDDSDKRVEVRTRQHEDEVIVEIADTGPGIPAEVRRHIFEPFVSTKSDEEGTGLGLAICRDIVDACGGTIEVESDINEGALFRVKLPTVDEVATESLEVVPERITPRQGRILVVDPERTLGESLRRLLKGQHNVTVVSSKGDAVELLGQRPTFDVVLCDLRFRGGVGEDLFRWVERQAPHYWEKMVAMTATRNTQSSRDYLESLPNPWLSKPFDIARLRAVIAGLLDAADRDRDVESGL